MSVNRFSFCSSNNRVTLLGFRPPSRRSSTTRSIWSPSSILGYAIIVACQYGVVNFLRQLGAPSHHRTHHNEIKRALVALALTPLCSLVPTAVMIGSNALQISLRQTFSAYLSLGMTVITLPNPIVTMDFVRPYREGLLCALRIRKRPVIAQSPTVIGSTFEPATKIPGITVVPVLTVPNVAESVG